MTNKIVQPSRNPKWERVLWRLYEYIPIPIEDILKRCYRCVLPLKGIRIPVLTLRGMTRPDGQPGTLIVAGDERKSSYLIHRFFESEPGRKAVGEVLLWNLPQTLERLQASADLTVVRVDRLSARLFFGADYLTVPEGVGSIMQVPEDLSKLVYRNNSLKNDLRKIRRNGFIPHVSHSESDFEAFYHTMYIPYVRKRHRKHGNVRNIYMLRKCFRQGGLLWVSRAGQPVAGAVFRLRNRVLDFLALGVADGEWTHVKEGATAALDLFFIESAKDLGYKFINWGASRPSLTDGVLRYKRKWGVCLNEKHDNWYDFLIRWNRLDGKVASFLSHTPLIFRDRDGLSAIHVIHNDKPVSQTEVRKTHHFMWICGLRRLYLVALSGWVAVQDNPPQTVLIGPMDAEDCNPHTLQSLGFIKGLELT